MLLIPQDELAKSNAPFADLLARFFGSGYGQLLAIFVVISGLGALNGWTLMAGELTQTFARHGTLPESLAKANAHAAPTRALLLTGCCRQPHAAHELHRVDGQGLRVFSA